MGIHRKHHERDDGLGVEIEPARTLCKHRSTRIALTIAVAAPVTLVLVMIVWVGINVVKLEFRPLGVREEQSFASRAGNPMVAQVVENPRGIVRVEIRDEAGKLQARSAADASVLKPYKLLQSAGTVWFYSGDVGTSVFTMDAAGKWTEEEYDPRTHPVPDGLRSEMPKGMR